MDEKSQSLIFIVFILIFFIVPPLLKLLGQYTLGSKKPTVPPPPEGPPLEEVPGGEYHDEDRHEAIGNGAPEVHNKPINPRWF